MTVDENNSKSFLAAIRAAIDNIRSIIPALEVYAGLKPGSLLVPEDVASATDLSAVKQFCVGLLENPTCHVWWPVVRALQKRFRVAIAGSLFLSRKMLPAQPSPWEHHAERVTSQPWGDLPPRYIAHVRYIAREVFPPGWDRGYEQRVVSFIPPTSATTSTPRSKGGARSEWFGRRLDMADAMLGIRGYKTPRFRVRFSNVNVDGKSRSVTIASASQAMLGPLHRCLYDAMSGKDWLLRGAATTGKMRAFCPMPGEVFVSGDYESATDYLPLEVAEAILEVARGSSREVPEDVWAHAFASLRAEIEYPDGSVRRVVRGQLMGNLLSFPLLCLQNYAAYRYAFRGCWKNRPVKINGDDIVFRCTEGEYQRWADVVSKVGLKLSRGKTMVDSRFFSINSSFFHAMPKAPRLIPVVRSSVLTHAVAVPHALSGGLANYARGFRDEARTILETVYLRSRRRQVTACGRSVLRDLRMPVSLGALKEMGWLKREAYYLSLPSRPLPMDVSRLGVPKLPRGWVREEVSRRRSERRRQRDAEQDFFDEVIDRAWACNWGKTRLARLVWDNTAVKGDLNGWIRFRRSTQLKDLGRLGRCRQYRQLAARQRVDYRKVFEFESPPRTPRCWVRKESAVSWNCPMEFQKE
jgi:hypothetical protein